MATIITFPSVDSAPRTISWGKILIILFVLVGIAAYFWTGYGVPISENSASTTKTTPLFDRSTPITDTALVAP